MHNWWKVDDPDLPPQCTGKAITESYEGAINIAELDGDLDEESNLPLDCFEGYTSRTFMAELRAGLEESNNTDEGQFDAVSALAVDGTCALALAIKRLMSQGATLDEIREPSAELFRTFVSTLSESTNFRGVSGPVGFTDNDKEGHLAVQQVREGSNILIGFQFANGTISLEQNEGPQNSAFKPAFPDEEDAFPFQIFQVLIPLLVVCCPVAIGCIKASQFFLARSGQQQSSA